MSQRTVLASVLFTSILQAADPIPVGILRGPVVSIVGDGRRGEIAFGNYRCSFNEKSLFERSREIIGPAALAPGDHLEVVADRSTDGPLCYARTIQVLESPVVRPRKPRSYAAESAADVIAPRGDITLTGVVVDISPQQVVIRTRTNERRTILLRPDTRYFGEGQALARSDLALTTRVFVRAGRNLAQQVEAYQIIWGEILSPTRAP